MEYPLFVPFVSFCKSRFFNTSLNDPPSAAQVQEILDVLNQLIGALLRS